MLIFATLFEHASPCLLHHILPSKQSWVIPCSVFILLQVYCITSCPPNGTGSDPVLSSSLFMTTASHPALQTVRNQTLFCLHPSPWLLHHILPSKRSWVKPCSVFIPLHVYSTTSYPPNGPKSNSSVFQVSFLIILVQMRVRIQECTS